MVAQIDDAVALIARGARPECLRMELLSPASGAGSKAILDTKISGHAEVSRARVLFSRSGIEGSWPATGDQTSAGARPLDGA
jgi:hypothetical protein